jgi:hypothetical protein
MIRSMDLKFGASPNSAPLNLTLSPITVFVGPNNSGKSRILAEIETYCLGPHAHPPHFILQNIDFSPYSDDVEIDKEIKKITLVPNSNETINPSNIFIGSRRGRSQVHPDGLRTLLRDPTGNIGECCRSFAAHRLIKLDGAGRIALANPQGAGDLLSSSTGTLSSLFLDDIKRAEVRRILFDAFGSYFVIDPTQLGTLRVRLSDQPPINPSRERSLDDEAIRFFRKAIPVDSMSDGVKAFVGIIIEMVAGDPGIILLDEPEAFLHPSLSYKLGLEIARAAKNSNKRVFASTHSPFFLMGCIQSGIEINIVRLTYRNEISTARALANADIVTLMRHPLLRSTNVLSALFAEFVIVTEADTDRAFYQEINERLIQFKDQWGIPNCLFLHAQNKQTISTIVKPLRRFGVPAASIADIDALKDGGKTWAALLESANIPDIERSGLADIRNRINRAMELTGKNMKVDGGIKILDLQDREGADNLLRRLGEYGVYLVPGGEVESWLKNLGATGHGPAWLIEMFELMGENPESVDYVRPADNDVWKFISDVRSWLRDPLRKGLPT